MKIPVLPPNINESYGGFNLPTCFKKHCNNNQNKSEKIRFGFYTIKNLGTDISDNIIEERKNPPVGRRQIQINHRFSGEDQNTKY